MVGQLSYVFIIVSYVNTSTVLSVLAEAYIPKPVIPFLLFLLLQGEVGDPNHLFCPAVTAPPTTPVTAKPTVKPTAPKTPSPTTKAPVTPAPTTKKPETPAPTACVPVLKGMGGDQTYGGNAGYYEGNSKRGYYGYSSSGSEKRSSKMGDPRKALHSKSSKHASKSSKKITEHSRKVSKGSAKGSEDIKGRDGYYGQMYRVETDGDGRLLKVGLPSPTVAPTICPEGYIPQVSDPNKVPDERRYYLKRRTDPSPKKPDEW